jgi:hypothetical protein
VRRFESLSGRPFVTDKIFFADRTTLRRIAVGAPIGGHIESFEDLLEFRRAAQAFVG